jgi:cobalt-zinc-cadmium efflux system outer membrane protein
MKMKSVIYLLMVSLLTVKLLPAQAVLTEQEAISMALKNSPALKAATLVAKQQKQLQGTSFNLANPDITMESPTGQFMTFGVLQSFEFPTVYVKQGQLAKQQTRLAEKGKAITGAEVSQRVKIAYLNLQFYNQIAGQLKTQDSIYKSIADAAARQFDAGQVDFVAKVYAAAQYGEVHNRFVQAQTDTAIALQQLQLFTGLSGSIIVSSLDKQTAAFSINTDSGSLASTPLISYYAQQQNVAKKAFQLERNKALPGFAFGYLNQGLMNTPIPLRLRAGINIPIWFWQYSAAIKAAKTNMLATEQNQLAQQQNITEKIQQLKGELLKSEASLSYYQAAGLKQADDLMESSARMFAAGKGDYITYMRTLSDAYNIRIRYYETLRNFNQSIIQLNYLNGQ